MRQGYVNAGGLFMFAGARPGTFEQDVLTSHLYIQSGKSIRKARFVGGHEWCQLYSQAMVSFGYTVIRNETESISPDPETSPWQAIKSRLLIPVGETLIDDARHTLDGLAQTHPGADEVLRSHALLGLASDGSDCLSPTPVAEEQRNPEPAGADTCPARVTVSLVLSFVAAAPVIHLVFVSFTTAVSANPPGFSQLLESGYPIGQLELSLVSAELDDLSYGRFRPAILQQLGSRLDQQLVRL